MDRGFDPYRRNYASLSPKDLLDARDLLHGTTRINVTASAIGLYRILNGRSNTQRNQGKVK